MAELSHVAEMDGRKTLAYEHWTNGHLVALQATLDGFIRDLWELYESTDSVSMRELIQSKVDKINVRLSSIALEEEHRHRVTGKTGLVVWPPEADFLNVYPETTSEYTQDILRRRKL